jgi:hypothetical protein
MLKKIWIFLKNVSWEIFFRVSKIKIRQGDQIGTGLEEEPPWGGIGRPAY